MQRFLVDVHMELLLERIGKGGDPVIERHRLDGKHGIVEYSKAPTGVYGNKGFIRGAMALKSIGGEEGCAPDCVGMEFSHADAEGVAVHQIPSIALKFSLNIGDQAWRSVEPQGFAAAERDAQHRVEADEVVHVRVRDEDVAGAREAGRA